MCTAWARTHIEGKQLAGIDQDEWEQRHQYILMETQFSSEVVKCNRHKFHLLLSSPFQQEHFQGASVSFIAFVYQQAKLFFFSPKKNGLGPSGIICCKTISDITLKIELILFN